MKLTPTQQLLAVGVGGLAVGAVLMGVAARKAQRELVQAAAAVPPVGVTPQLISSTSSLNNGWLYFLTLVTNTDLTQAASVTALAASLQAAGFVDPTTKGPPTVTVVNGTTGQTLAIFNGTTGTSIPASTAALTWASVLGYPPPEGLATT